MNLARKLIESANHEELGTTECVEQIVDAMMLEQPWWHELDQDEPAIEELCNGS